MEDKKNLTEKELLNVAGGNQVTDYVRNETCNRISNKNECEAQEGCKWVEEAYSKPCVYQK